MRGGGHLRPNYAALRPSQKQVGIEAIDVLVWMVEKRVPSTPGIWARPFVVWACSYSGFPHFWLLKMDPLYIHLNLCIYCSPLSPMQKSRAAELKSISSPSGFRIPEIRRYSCLRTPFHRGTPSCAKIPTDQNAKNAARIAEATHLVCRVN